MLTKQVIIIRKDLKMRRGKEIAQGAHASMKVFFDRMERIRRMPDGHGLDREMTDYLLSDVNEEMDNWIKGVFTKVVVYVNSLEELEALESKAKELGVPCAKITDNGYTEFHGEATVTALAVGPDYSLRVDAITGHLPLY